MLVSDYFAQLVTMNIRFVLFLTAYIYMLYRESPKLNIQPVPSLAKVKAISAYIYIPMYHCLQ